MALFRDVFLLLTCSLFQRVLSEELMGKSAIDPASLRLPTALIPVHYLVRLQPFLSGNFSTEGSVDITFDVKEATDQIVLHMADIITKNDTLKITRIDTPDQAVKVLSQSFDNVRQFYIVKLAQQFELNHTYNMHLEFVGYLNEDLKGFYRSSYNDKDGNEVMLACTQFEATDARRAFPCFDEPAMKAKFTIEIARQEGYRTISNMPRGEEKPYDGKEGWFWDNFNTSLPMSSYLVAFVVSDFVSVESKKHPGSDYFFRVWSRKDAIAQAEYALAAGPNMSHFYEGYFGVKFPLPKQDMVALPDFSAGAMENWGIITYREGRILMVPERTTAKDKFGIASVIAHELGHMWFGDLVSPAWWTELWLNEGFATFVEYKAVNNFDPSMKPLDQFVLDELHKALELDSLDSSHPISQTVHDPDEINELFDTISYSKGASVLQMISNVLTEDTFRRALTNYLTQLSYHNAKQDDLWHYLTEQAHKDGTLGTAITVKQIMDTWTLQMGYPVIDVTQNEDGSLTVAQERFLLSKSDNDNVSYSKHTSSINSRWWVPLSYTTSSELDFEHTAPREWLSNIEDRKVIQDVLTDDDKWYIFNVRQTGYYRVNYDINNWKALIAQLVKDHTVIEEINRAQIIDDAFNLAKAGLLDYKIPLSILSYLKNETEYLPLQAALNNMNYIRNMFVHHSGEEALKQILKSVVVPLYNRVGFEDDLSDTHLEQRKRSELISVACDIGYQPCVDASTALFKKWMENPSDESIISPNVKSAVLCTAIAAGGDTEWQFAWERYEATNVAGDRPILLTALGCSNDTDTLNRYMADSLTSRKGIRKQDADRVIQSVANNEVGKSLAWDFVQERWMDILNYFGSVSFTLDRVISVTDNLNTHENLDRLKTFRTENSGHFSSAKRAVDQAVEKVTINVDWMDKYADTILNWIKDTTAKKSH